MLTSSIPLGGQPPVLTPRQLFEEAVQAQQRGDDAAALRNYNQIVSSDPRATWVRVNLGGTLAHMGRFDDAIQQYRLVLAENPGNRPVILNLAFALKEKGDVRQASALLEPIHSSAPEDLPAAMLLADCYLHMEKRREAIALLSPLEAKNPDDLDLAWTLGTALIDEGRSREGVERIEKVAVKAASAEAYLLAGNTRLARDEYDLAKSDADAALRLNPQLAGVQTLEGMVLQHAGDLPGAAAALRQALKLNASDFDAHLYLGAILYFRRDLEEARMHLERALALQPGSARARYELALVSRSQGHLDVALREIEAVCHSNPDWLEPHVDLSALYYRLQRPAEGAREREIVDRLLETHKR